MRAFEDELGQLIARLGARTTDREQRLYFPEHVVLVVLADRATIELMLFARLSIVELRRATDSPAFFLDDIDRDEQRDVCEELSERTEWPGMDVPAVCLLDTGVNRAHILIEPTLAEADMAAVKAEWGSPIPRMATARAWRDLPSSETWLRIWRVLTSRR